MIVMDDIEAGESQTGSTDVAKLLKTVQDDIFPLSLNAHVVWVGTTTRPGGLTENLVHKALDMPHDEWADTENFKVNYWPALKVDGFGVKRSIWEPRWSTVYLLSQEHTRSFAKNYLCLPAPEDFAYWRPELFQYKEPGQLDYVMLSVDPAVTVTEKSDGTGLAVVGYSIAERKTYVLHCESVKLSGADLRARAATILEMYPGITLIYAEINNGGDLVTDLFSPLPVKVKSVRQSIAKNVRASTSLAEYEKGNVYHSRRLAQAEAEMIAFPQKGFHDDCVDAIGSGVIYFSQLNKPKTGGVKVTSGNYA